MTNIWEIIQKNGPKGPAKENAKCRKIFKVERKDKCNKTSLANQIKGGGVARLFGKS